MIGRSSSTHLCRSSTYVVRTKKGELQYMMRFKPLVPSRQATQGISSLHFLVFPRSFLIYVVHRTTPNQWNSSGQRPLEPFYRAVCPSIRFAWPRKCRKHLQILSTPYH